MNTPKALAALAVLVLASNASFVDANPVTRVFKCAPNAGCATTRIPDSNGTTDGVADFTIPVPAGDACPGTTSSYGVHVWLEHANVGDLRIALVSPSSTSANALDRAAATGYADGSCAGDDVHAMLTDLGTSPVSCFATIPSLRGNLVASAPLSTLGNTWQPGDWHVQVRDQAAGGDGRTIDVALVVLCGYDDAIFNDGFDLP